MFGGWDKVLFNSYVFVFLFLPLCLLGYFLLNKLGKLKLANAFLLAMSLWFYAYFNHSYLLIIMSSVVLNFGIYRLLERSKKQTLRKLILLVGLAANIGIIFYFKYWDFFISNINAALKTNFALARVLLPLGISFFTFQQLSFVIDAYKKEVPKYSFLDYACFVTFFPQLIAGPIVTHDELVPQLSDVSKKKICVDNVVRGLYIFALGLSKKVLIADMLGNVSDVGFSDIASLDATNALLVMFAYTFQIYFDFSGYCDMAIGIGKMFNIDLPLNFNSPYKALNIVDFWDRWHITLNRFFTKYVYIPLGGNRQGNLKTYRNIMIVFLLSGIWHGASWSFVFWGVCHGVLYVITRHKRESFQKMHPALGWLLTFLFVSIMWVFFRANSLQEAFSLLNKIAKMDFGPISYNILYALHTEEFALTLNLLKIGKIYPNIMFLLAAFFCFLVVLGAKNSHEKMLAFEPKPVYAVWTAFLLGWSIFSLGAVSKFLYFNF